MTTICLFFISNKIVGRKQILQATSICYNIRSIFFLIHGLSFSQNESMNLLVNSFLHFRQWNLKYWQRMSLINTREEIPSKVKSIPFTFFLKWQILFTHFCFESLMITRLGSLLGNQWQSSIFKEWIPASSFLKIFKVVSSKFIWWVLSGISLVSRHSRLEYWELLEQWRSKETICFFQFIIDLLATLSSDSSFAVLL